MEKKKYTAPTLNSKDIELGVFGDYSDSGEGDGNRGAVPGPVDVIRKLDLHME